METKNSSAPGKKNGDPVLPMPLSNIQINKTDQKRPVNPLLSQNGTLPFSAMLDVPIEMIFEVGRTHISIKQLMEMTQGSFVELKQISVDIIDIRINDTLFGFGETIALQQHYGIRFSEHEIIPGVDDAEK
ncbi:MAG: FliM/FliN family flagellar motor switch protein [Pseudomonadota bacterium]